MSTTDRPLQPSGVQISPNSGKAYAKRAGGKTQILALTYNVDEVEAMRRLASRLVIKGDKHPAMSLLARRGLEMVTEAFERDPEGLAARLGRMVTDDPAPAPASRKKNKGGAQ